MGEGSRPFQGFSKGYMTLKRGCYGSWAPGRVLSRNVQAYVSRSERPGAGTTTQAIHRSGIWAWVVQMESKREVGVVVTGRNGSHARDGG